MNDDDDDRIDTFILDRVTIPFKDAKQFTSFQFIHVFLSVV